MSLLESSIKSFFVALYEKGASVTSPVPNKHSLLSLLVHTKFVPPSALICVLVVKTDVPVSSKSSPEVQIKSKALLALSTISRVGLEGFGRISSSASQTPHCEKYPLELEPSTVVVKLNEPVKGISSPVV